VTVATGGIWTTTGNGIFTPSANVLNPVYDPAGDAGTVVTLTLTSTGNGTCNEVSDVITVNIADAPQADAGGDQTICADAAS
jgi:hypothetical protein